MEMKVWFRNNQTYERNEHKDCVRADDEKDKVEVLLYGLSVDLSKNFVAEEYPKKGKCHVRTTR